MKNLIELIMISVQEANLAVLQMEMLQQKGQLITENSVEKAHL